MRTAAKIAVMPILLLVVAFVVRVWFFHHGHVDERLDVTVRIVDRGTGQPLQGAVAAIVRHRSFVGRDFLAWYLQDVFKADPEEQTWRWPVGATRTTDKAETTIRTSAYVTRYWLGPIEVSKEVGVPDVLLIDHPRFDREIVPIDQALERGSEPNTWHLDLGTVYVSR